MNRKDSQHRNKPTETSTPEEVKAYTERRKERNAAKRYRQLTRGKK